MVFRKGERGRGGVALSRESRKKTEARRYIDWGWLKVSSEPFVPS
jgi:hypothetical protein